MPLPSELVHQIGDAICVPVGTVTFEYSSTEAFKQNSVAGVLVEIPANGHFFRVDRTSERVLRFFHSSPGTGTRVASIPLGTLPDFEKAFLAFSWSPEEVTFCCTPRGVESELLTAKGIPSPINFRIGRDGRVFQIGDEGIQVMGVRFHQDGQPVLAPTAIEAWQNTTKAIEILLTGKSEEGFIFEVVQTSAILSMLVTGLESYAKTRLLELESEGISADWNALFMSFASKAERESNRLSELEAKATAANKTVLTEVVNALGINLQNYDDLKRAYRAAYGINLGEVGVDSQMLSRLQDFIRYRHRVVHVSPLLTILNQDKVPPAEPVFANRKLSEDAEACFKSVIEALHRATLGLRPSAKCSPTRTLRHKAAQCRLALR
jgi:hypothetical protein